MELLIGTNNRGKFIEMSDVLSDLPIRIRHPEDLSIIELPEETGTTFQENALLKARAFFHRAGIPTVADDSGIEVEALRGELGMHTRRWGAGPQASDEEWITHFLHRMRREPNKQARFICHLAYIDAHGKEHHFEGTCNGAITESLEAGYLPGLPISACFKPNGFDCVYSAMSIEQKNSTSHRGKALQSFRNFLRELRETD